MSKHNFKTHDGAYATEWDLEFGPNSIRLSLEQMRGGAPITLHTELTPAQAEDLREMLQLYQNQRRRMGKGDR